MHKQKNDGHWRQMALCGIHWLPPAPDDLLIGIDDTDNLDSPGTGFHARELARLIFERGLGMPKGITRHQLLVNPRIPYTSHNSSACLCVSGAQDDMAVRAACRTYLQAASAPGSDAGLCVARRAAVPAAIVEWGAAAKIDVLHQQDARLLANRQRVHLLGLTGDEGGVIGALAAVGLHSGGNDGRFLWQRGLRERGGETVTAIVLRNELSTDVACLDGAAPADDVRIHLGEWPRSVFRNHQPVLLVEESNGDELVKWRVVAKEVLKRY